MDNQRLTLREAYLRASSFLDHAGVGDSSLQAEQLLCHLLDCNRGELFMRWAEPFPMERQSEWESLLARKAAGEPLQYIVGEQHFYGLPFWVEPAVLIPRPETELLVERIIAIGRRLWPASASAASTDASHAMRLPDAPPTTARTAPPPASLAPVPSPLAASPSSGAPLPAAPRATPLIADIGTGSGAIPISIAANCPHWRIIATDISPPALAVARRNAKRHGVAERIRFLEGDLLAPLIQAQTSVDILVSNPPYIPSAHIGTLQPEVRLHEPRSALDGGIDGLDFYRRLLQEMSLLPAYPRLIGFEVGQGQAREVADMIRACGQWSEVEIIPDWAGIDRHVIGIAI